IAPTTGTPTGTVTFMDGTTPLGTPVTLNNGQATFMTANLTGGTHTITAVYSGDTNFGGSTSSPLTQTVNRINTTTTLVTAPTATTQSPPFPPRTPPRLFWAKR